MIAYLRGHVTRRQPPELVLEAGGVGYRVLATVAALAALPPEDEEVTLVTQLVVREDAHTLYGFADEEERERFCWLTRIPGVGAKTALAILSTLPGSTLDQYVREGDAKALTRVPGIGGKTAQRLLLEMRDKLPGSSESDPTGATMPEREAEQALVRLGWKPTEARRMVTSLETSDLDAEAILRRVLQGQVA